MSLTEALVQIRQYKRNITMPTRGIRNNNPGNLRHNPHIKWLGEISPDPQGYCVFIDAAHGLRAMAIDLHTKWARGLNTVRKIIEAYAPPNENDTEAYIKFVAKQMMIDPDVGILLVDIQRLSWMMTAMMLEEDGPTPYPRSWIDTAAGVAIAYNSSR